MNTPRLILIIIALISLGDLVWLAISQKTDVTHAPGTVHVVTILFPLYDMARTIGGTGADVTLLLPPGVESHSFEPSPSDIAAIHNADIFIYTGPFMEP
jgi:zinc transport system substrate-binding protein